MLAAALLAASLVVLYLFLRNDAAEYAAFQLLTRTEDRQRTYRRWVIKSFLRLSGMAFVLLAVLRRAETLMHLPKEFLSLSGRLRHFLPLDSLSHSGGFIGGFSGAVIGGLGIGIWLSTRVTKTPDDAASSSHVEKLQPMMPRNATETVWTTLLSINAGFSEELFFRLVLPLLIVTLTGNAVAAGIIATMLFGLAHFYQGVVGVLITTLMGAVLALVYITSASIWIAMAIHAGIDLFHLVLRPSLTRAMSVR